MKPSSERLESLRRVLAPDPRRMYQEGGGRNWSFLIESLRKALR